MRLALLAQTVLLLYHLPIGFRKPTRNSVKMWAGISASPSLWRMLLMAVCMGERQDASAMLGVVPSVVLRRVRSARRPPRD